MTERGLIVDAREATGLHDGSITKIIRVMMRPAITMDTAAHGWLIATSGYTKVSTVAVSLSRVRSASSVIGSSSKSSGPFAASIST